MKRDFLKNLDLGNGAHLSDDLVEQIMAEDGKAKTEMQNTITSLTTERDGLKTQLSDANAAIQSYKDMDIEGIKQSAADWETKYNTDTQALKDQLKGVQYAHAVENAVGGMRFTSESAKKAFVADLTAKQLPIQEGKLLGLDDFTKSDWISIHPPHVGRDSTSSQNIFGNLCTYHKTSHLHRNIPQSIQSFPPYYGVFCSFLLCEPTGESLFASPSHH